MRAVGRMTEWKERKTRSLKTNRGDSTLRKNWRQGRTPPGRKQNLQTQGRR